jgi:hypothetical protein
MSVTKFSRFSALAFAAVALVATAADARAQAGGISIQAPKIAKLQVESGEVATMAFAVLNNGKDTTVAEPKVIVPAGWRVVMSPAATVIAPGERDIWLVSVKAPANAAAGTYTVRLDGTRQLISARGPAAPDVVSDSVAVTIAERHEVAVRSAGALSYVMGGQSYVGPIIIQNLGNVASRFDLVARSTQGEAPSLASEVIALAPGQVDTVKATVMIPATITGTAEEVLLLSAVDVVVDSVRAEAALQATVVPSAKNGPTMWTVPTEVAIRTATPGSGVSAFVANGYGKLTQNSDVLVDFLVRGPTGKTSMFGEQETYHLGLRTKRSSLSIGDDAYGFSRMLSSGARGRGAMVRSELKGFTGGAYIQRDPRAAGPTEMSAMVGTSEKRAVSASLVALNRASANGSAQAITLGTRASIRGADIGFDYAASDSDGVAGRAGRVQLNGNAPLFAYDLSAAHASTGFASSQQGSTDLRAAAVGHAAGGTVITANTMFHKADPLASIGGFGQKLSTTSLGAAWANGLSVEAEHFDRADIGGFEPVIGTTETMRVRGRYALGILDAAMNLQAGAVAPAASAKRAALGVGGTVTAQVDDGEYVALFADFGNGNGLGESGSSTLSAGVNSQLRFNTTTLRVMTYASQSIETGKWTSQSDLAIEQAFRRSTIALRGRLATMSGGPTQNAIFLEVKTPLGLPTSAVNAIGRARAEVIDAETGKGIAGALVRLGGQAAVTDASGVATFRDVKPGQHRALVDGAAVAGRVVSGGSAVTISGTSKKPTQFRMSLSRGAQILVRLRSFERNSAIAGNGDTLTEVGAVGQVMVALVTPTDTLWQTSDERGRVDFGSVVPGHYTVAIPRYDAPEHTAFAETEFVVDVAAGEQRQVDFRLIPEVRAVEFQGEAILIAAPAATAKKAPVSTTITGKPEATPITGRPDEAPITARPTTSSPITTPARSQRQKQNQRQQRNQRQNEG